MTVKKTLIALLVLTLYVLGGKWGLQFAIVHTSVTAVWPPTGIALAAFLLFGSSLWPVIFLGAFIVNITTAGSIPVCLAIALGNTLEGWLGATWIQRYAGGINVFDRPRNIVRFVLYAGLGSTAVSATIGVATLVAGGLISGQTWLAAWVQWWLGDAMGNFLIAPPLVLWARSPRLNLARRQAMEFTLLFAALIAISYAVFSGAFAVPSNRSPLEFLFVPILLWAAFRFGRRVAVTVTFILAFMAVWGTFHSQGPFPSAFKNSYLLLQTYLAVISLISISVATVVWELKRVRDDLRPRTPPAGALSSDGLSVAEMVRNLKASEERFRSVVDGVKDYAIFMLDSLGAIRSWTEGAEKIVGYQPEDIIGRHFSCLYCGEDITNGEPMRHLKVAETEGRIEVEGFRLRKDGTTFWADLVITALRDESGRLKGFSSVTRDITERRQAEQALLQKERLLAYIQGEREQWSHFAQLASDDLQEPIRKILTLTDHLKNDLAGLQYDGGRGYIEQIQKATAHLGRLIHSVARFSQAVPQKTEFESVDLASVVRDVLEDLELRIRDANGRVLVGALPVIDANRGQMHELFLNLLKNAIQFRKKGVAPQITINSRTAADGGVEIRIEDNGIGFDEGDSARLFKPFERIRAGEDGLSGGVGLAICQSIVASHGGSISATSAPPGGATFIINLPRRTGPPLFSPSTEGISKSPK